MKRFKLIATALMFAVLAVVLATRVTAQNANTQERTFLTFTSSVEMPGVTLQPGTYVFKLSNNNLSRNVVEVWDQNEKNMLGHWTFVQAERPQVTEDTVVMFKEAREGATPAVQFWYFPGEKVGKEFIYPKEQAARIAARTGTTVRTDEIAVQSSVAAAEPVAEVTPEPVAVAAAEPEPAPAPAVVAEAPAPAPAPAPVAPVVEDNRVAANTSADRAVGTSGRLPKTASPLVLSELLGLLSLTGAAGLRLLRS